MKNLFKSLAVSAALTLSAFATASDKPTLIGWSHFVTWESLGVAQSEGIVDKYNEKYGTNVEFKYIGDYIDSITLYTDRDLAGVATTTMDILAFAGVGKRHSEVLRVTDYSNSADAVMIKGYSDLNDALDNGATVNLIEFSVSHYLLASCVEAVGGDIDDLVLENAKTDAVIPSTLKAKSQFVGVTWNPLLETVKGISGAKVACDSSSIKGEILDTVVVGDEVTAAEKKTILASINEVLSLMAKRDGETLKAVAEQAGTSTKSINMMLDGVEIFDTTAKEAKFVNDSANLRRIMDKVTTFSFNAGVWDAVDSKDELGIKFADGSVLGDPNNIVLTFPAR